MTPLADWRRFTGTACVFIDPGSAWQTAWIVSFNGSHWDLLLEARRFIEAWRIVYNNN